MTGQSQNTQKSCFKSSTQNAKKDILGHVAIRCHLSNILRGWGIITMYTRIATISRLDIFYFQTEYFWLKSGRTPIVGPSNPGLLE